MGTVSLKTSHCRRICSDRNWKSSKTNNCISRDWIWTSVRMEVGAFLSKQNSNLLYFEVICSGISISVFFFLHSWNYLQWQCSGHTNRFRWRPGRDNVAFLWMKTSLLFRYGVWATMTPASIIVGLCAAPLWTAQCSYFTLEAGRYAALSKETEEAVVSRFFGIFFCFFQMCTQTFIVSKTTLVIIEKKPTHCELVLFWRRLFWSFFGTPER